MSNSYILNVPYSLGRLSLEEKESQKRVAAKWEPVEITNEIVGNTCANVERDMVFENGKPLFLDYRGLISFNSFERLYRIIPSCLFLYRLLAVWPSITVDTNVDYYKVIWQIALKHKETGEHVVFGDFKGAQSFWTKYSKHTELPRPFRDDLLELVGHIVSDKCMLPYDRTVAGSVA